MIESEAAQLLAFAAAYDQRTIGGADVQAWAMALADVPWDGSTRAAVAAFYGAPDGGGTPGERRFMQPHNVRTGRTRIRHDRLARVVEPPPNEVEGVSFPQELRALRAAIADGLIPDQDAATRYTRWGGSLHLAQTRGAVPSFADGPVQPLPQRPVAELIAGVFQTVPPADPEPAFRYDHEAEQRRKDAAAQHRSAVHADAQRALQELRRHRADIGLPDPDLEEAP